MSLKTNNIFAALDTKKKKKSSKSSKESSDKRKKEQPVQERADLLQQHLFSGDNQPQISNWADTDEEDDFDDDIAPLPSSWLVSQQQNGEADTKDGEEASDSDDGAAVDEIHEALGLEVSKDDDEDEEDEDEDEEHRSGDQSAEEAGTAPVQTPALQAPVPEKQLSKKEKKKQELEEMNRVLAELGIEPNAAETKLEESRAVETIPEVDGADKENQAEETGVSKKKKKKDKEKKLLPAKEDSQTQDETESDEPATVIDPAEARKLLAKKKAALAKKGTQTASSIAAKEARERAAKKAKVKDKKNYNQAPTR